MLSLLPYNIISKPHPTTQTSGIPIVVVAVSPLPMSCRPPSPTVSSHPRLQCLRLLVRLLPCLFCFLLRLCCFLCLRRALATGAALGRRRHEGLGCLLFHIRSRAGSGGGGDSELCRRVLNLIMISPGGMSRDSINDGKHIIQKKWRLGAEMS